MASERLSIPQQLEKLRSHSSGIDSNTWSVLEGIMFNLTGIPDQWPPKPSGRKPHDLIIKETLEAEAIPPLSVREIQVLQLRARGFKEKEIGFALGIARGTVQSHIDEIGSKLSTGDKSGLRSVLIGVDRKIIDPFSVIEDLGLRTESINRLSKREKELLNLILEQKFLNIELLAKKLFTTSHTIKNHLDDIRKILSTSTIPAVILYSVYLKEQNKPKEPANIQS